MTDIAELKQKIEQYPALDVRCDVTLELIARIEMLEAIERAARESREYLHAHHTDTVAKQCERELDEALAAYDKWKESQK